MIILMSFIVSWNSFGQGTSFFFFKYRDRAFYSKLKVDEIKKFGIEIITFFWKTMKTFFFDVFKSYLMLHNCIKKSDAADSPIFHDPNIHIGGKFFFNNKCSTATSNHLII